MRSSPQFLNRFLHVRKHTPEKKAALERESWHNNQQQTTTQNKQQQTTTMVSLFSFLLLYLSKGMLMNSTLHSTINKEVRNDFWICWLFLPNSPSWNPKIRQTMRRRKNTKKTSQTAKDGKFCLFLNVFIKIKTHPIISVWQQKKKGMCGCFCCWLLFRSLTLSQNIQNRQLTQLDTTKHKKQQNKGKNMFDSSISFVFLCI